MLKRTVLTALVWFATAGAAMAQITAVPKEVVLYVHQDLDSPGLVDQLVCELSAVLVAPVRAAALDLPIDLSLVASGNELHAERLIGRLYQTVARERAFGTDTFVFLLVPYYLRNERFSTFGTTFGLPYNMGVVSIGSLLSSHGDLDVPETRKIVARRAYKVTFRYVAHMSGLWERNGCVLAFPQGIGGIDRKPAELCEDDRAMLVQAGVVKSSPSGPCAAVAMAR